MSADQTPLDLPSPVLEYLAEQHTVTLATSSLSGVPRASTFLYVNDGPTLYFWSRATTITARQIDQNPVVSFAIDEYSPDLSQTRGVQGIGEAGVLLSGEQIARVADLFGQKFPALSPGSTMSISFFRIKPSELQFIDNSTTAGAGGSAPGTFGAEFHRDRSYSVIDALPAQAADSIVATLQSIEVPAGETIVRQGAPADKCFIVVEGEAEILRENAAPEPLRAGQLFGEVAIMRDQPRSATVRARTAVKLLALERDTFRDLIAQSLEIVPDFDRVIRARMTEPGSASS